MNNFAELWEAHVAADPDGVVLIEDGREVTWSGLDRAAGALARTLLRAGLGRQARVACLLHNGAEYVETVFAAVRAAMVPVNVNYRYAPREAAYVLDNADAEAVVFHTSLTDLVTAIRPGLPRVRVWIAVDDGAPVPEWATDYRATDYRAGDYRAGGVGRVFGGVPWGRRGDDLILVYTGGTTGMPKGVMWRQDELISALGLVTSPPEPDAEQTRTGSVVSAGPAASADPADPADPAVSAAPSPLAGRLLPASPLMHAAGLFSALATLTQRGCLVLVTARRPRAADFLDAVARHRVGAMGLVGDAFARPLVDALDAEPGRWDLTSLATILSSGVTWSETAKRRLLGHLPGVSLLDLLGSTEAIGIGRSETTLGNLAATGRFRAADPARLIDGAGRVRTPDPGVRGRLAISGYLPVGYHKDPEMTAATFPTFDGVRYAVPGDVAEVGPDGELRLLGRGSGCINSGGEKIFPEEVEEVLKLHPSVRDAACLGVPDERFGEVVCAVVEATPGSTPDLAEIRAHTGAHLAGFKAPRRLVVVDRIDRGAAGKLDYPALRRRVAEQSAVPS